MNPDEERLIPVFVPALGHLLIRAEDEKGEPLTEEEVRHVRDNAPCIMMPIDDARRLDQKRGYHDIDPENCWHDWQHLRAELGRTPDLPPGPKFALLSNE